MSHQLPCHLKPMLWKEDRVRQGCSGGGVGVVAEGLGRVAEPPTLSSCPLAKLVRQYRAWASGLSSRLYRAIHTCPSSLFSLCCSEGATVCQRPFSNRCSLPGEEN